MDGRMPSQHPLRRHYAAVSLWLLMASAGAVEPLTAAAEVRDLLPAEAATALPIHLSGVVTYYRSEAHPDFVLQDDTGGVHVRQLAVPKGPGVSVAPGDVVEVEGVTDAADYAPRVDAHSVRRIGHGPLPAPQPTTVEDLQAGYHEGRLIEVGAVVRAVHIDSTIDPPRLVLHLASATGSIDAMVVRFAASDRDRYLDAGVRLHGIPLRLQNRHAEPFRWVIFTHGVDDIVVDEPPPADPFMVNLVPIDAVMAGGPQKTRHRQRIRGVVTCSAGTLVVQDGSHGICVHTSEDTHALVGDEVEVAGFARLGIYDPVLENSLVRVIGHPGRPDPEKPDFATLKPRALAERDWRLVMLDGSVAEFTGDADGRQGFTLRWARGTIPVQMPDGIALHALVARDAQVRITGVLELVPGRDVVLLSDHPTTFSLRVATAEDVEVLRAAPWWTRGRLATVLVAAAASLVLVLLWAWTLMRRVRMRSSQLASAIQARHDADVTIAATANERRRLAGELHDSLEQGLTGVALQLDATRLALADPPSQLLLAQSLLAHNRAEVRHAVWDLNAEAGPESDLPRRLRTIIERIGAARNAPVTVLTEGTVRPVAGRIAHHLGRLVEEGVNNALRHGNAPTVSVLLVFADERLTLSIIDDGAGFDPANAPGPNHGHFGLQGLRERARRINAELIIDSVPSHGTRLSLAIDLGNVP